MKKVFSLIAIVAVITTLTSCKTNMRRDAKLLAHKTEQCFSIIDSYNPDSEAQNKYLACYDDLKLLMDKMDQRYSKEKTSKKFSEMFIEEVMRTDLSDEMKGQFKDVYELSE